MKTRIWRCFGTGQLVASAASIGFLACAAGASPSVSPTASEQISAGRGDVVPTAGEVLIEFGARASVFRAVDDRVMGGISRSSLTATGDGMAMFRGNLSLENNGGFASVRAEGFALNLGGMTTLTLRIRGDGRTYKLRLHDERVFDGIAFQIAFDTVADEWVDLDLPLEAFQPVWRGRLVHDAPPLNRERVVMVGLMISDGQEGEFALEVDTLSGR